MVMDQKVYHPLQVVGHLEHRAACLVELDQVGQVAWIVLVEACREVVLAEWVDPDLSEVVVTISHRNLKDIIHTAVKQIYPRSKTLYVTVTWHRFSFFRKKNAAKVYFLFARRRIRYHLGSSLSPCFIVIILFLITFLWFLSCPRACRNCVSVMAISKHL